MKPPVLVQKTRDIMQGEVIQQRMEANITRAHERATHMLHQPVVTSTKEIGQAVYVTGPTTEHEVAAQVTQERTEQIVAGEVQQQIVEIPTIQEEIIEQEVHEIQTVNKFV